MSTNEVPDIVYYLNDVPFYKKDLEKFLSKLISYSKDYDKVFLRKVESSLNLVIALVIGLTTPMVPIKLDLSMVLMLLKGI